MTCEFRFKCYLLADLVDLSREVSFLSNPKKRSINVQKVRRTLKLEALTSAKCKHEKLPAYIAVAFLDVRAENG